MMKRTLARSSRGRRGSVFILVVAVLSVLVLLTLTLSYVSRMDLLASRNFGNTVQSRMAAITGVPLFASSTGSANVAYAPRRSGNMSATATVQNGQYSQAGQSNMQGQESRMGQRGQRGMSRHGGQNRSMGQMGQMVSLGTMGSPSSMGSGNSLGLMNQMGMSGGQTEAALTPFPMALTLQDSNAAGVAMAATTTRPSNTAMGSRGMTGMRGMSAANSGGVSSTGTASALGATSTTSTNLATALIEDETAKININAVIPDGVTPDRGRSNQLLSSTGSTLDAPDRVTETMLAKLIAEVATAQGLGGVDAQGLAHRIALRRYGADGRPGRGFTDDNANNGMTDPRNDGIDNDGDGQTDEDDELQTATAHDGLDNNRNGVIDEAGESIAQDGLDNNHNGKVDEANEAIDDPAESSSDPRKPAIGDDKPYSVLEELMSIDGMTPALYRALTPYLTVFSVSFAAYAVDEDEATGTGGMMRSRGSSRMAPGPNASEALTRSEQGGRGRVGGASASSEATAQGLPQIDPNTAPPEMLYEVLKQRFPEASDDLLGQFIANLIDRRDQDSLPTTVRIGSKSFTGMEINPCINEICPDPTPGENNDGQFIELYNPWSQAVNLTGWSLRGQGIQTPLNGTLPSGGFLVLTNDINNENDASPEDDGNEGSFYNVFHKVGTGGQHQLVEIQGMNLAAGSGKVQLVNAQGMVVDEFDYSQGQCSGTTRSFQRKDPRLRAWEMKPATPLEMNQGEAPTTDNQQALKIMEQWQNQPFRSPLEVMLVSTAFAEGGQTGSANAGQIVNAIDSINSRSNATGLQDGQQGNRLQTRGEMAMAGEQADAGTDSSAETSTRHAYAIPQLNVSGSDNLDVRLVDCFRIGAVIPSANDTEASELVGTVDDASVTASAASSSLGTVSGLRGRLGQSTSGGRMGRSLSGGRGRSMSSGQRSLNDASGATSTNATGEASLPEAPRCQAVFGLVNLNTASAAVLATLPGMDEQLLAKILASRASGMMWTGSGNRQAANLQALGSNDAAWWMAESPLAQPRWENLSDYLKDESLWEGRPLYDRLDATYAYSQLVTMHTMSVLVATASRPSEPVEAKPQGQTVEMVTKSGKRPSMARTQRIIAGDRGAPETVSFKFMRNYGEKQVDPDALYAAPADKVKAMNLKELMTKVAQAGGKVSAEMTPRALMSNKATESATSAANLQALKMARSERSRLSQTSGRQ